MIWLLVVRMILINSMFIPSPNDFRLWETVRSTCHVDILIFSHSHRWWSALDVQNIWRNYIDGCMGIRQPRRYNIIIIIIYFFPMSIDRSKTNGNGQVHNGRISPRSATWCLTYFGLLVECVCRQYYNIVHNAYVSLIGIMPTVWYVYKLL